FLVCHAPPWVLHPFPTRRSSDLSSATSSRIWQAPSPVASASPLRATSTPTARSPRCSSPFMVRRPTSQDSRRPTPRRRSFPSHRSEEHTSELQSRENLVCRLLLE